MSQLVNHQGFPSSQPLSTFLSKLAVKYNDDDFAYLESKDGYSDTSAFNAGSNVIHVATVLSDDEDANTGLGYDDNTDRFVITEWSSGNVHLFTREDYITAANASGGTLPSIDAVLSLTGSQGVSIDPINQRIYKAFPNGTTIRIFDFDENLIEEFTAPSPATGTMVCFDAVTGTLYLSTGPSSPVYGLKKIGSTWTIIFISWYRYTEGVAIDYMFDKMVGNAGDAVNLIREQTRITGLDIICYPYPLTSVASVQEGFIVDVKDGTFWFNSDQGFHGSIVGGNRLWHTDPRKLYRKYYRTPDMDTWQDVWSLGNNVAVGRLNGQKLTGNDWSIGPVIDFGSHTGQQTLANWFGLDDEEFEIEFRGSSSAPDTTPLPSRDYHTLEIYSANESNDGWGSTSPGSWQSTPTTDRYMQVRVKPLGFSEPPADPWTPINLGSKLLKWFNTDRTSNHQELENSFVAAYYQDYSSQRFIRLVDMKGGQLSQFTQTTASQRPILTDNDAMRFIGMNRNMIIDSVANFLAEVGDEVEVHFVARKSAANDNAVFIGASDSASTNNQLRLGHTNGNGSPANYLHIRHVDESGNVNFYGVTDTSFGTFRMLTFQLGSTENKIFVNKVEQTLTVESGSNAGQSFADVAANVNNIRLGRVHASTSVQGATDIKEIVITSHLTLEEREELYDYFVAKGIL